MVRAIIIVSALFALVASVSAVPAPRVASVQAGYIGTGKIIAKNALSRAVNIPGARVQRKFALIILTDNVNLITFIYI
jgi:hypothetical protein